MIYIGENWRFSRQVNNYTLERLKTVEEKIDRVKTGRTKRDWIEVAYFSGLHQVYLYVLERDAAAAKTLQEFDDRLEAMGNKILAAIKNNPGES